MMTMMMMTTTMMTINLTITETNVINVISYILSLMKKKSVGCNIETCAELILIASASPVDPIVPSFANFIFPVERVPSSARVMFAESLIDLSADLI